jgi:hypothetical protein
MGYEYFAHFTTEAIPPLSELVEVVQRARLCEVESLEEKTARLRWAGTPRREDWPEDVTLSYLKNSLCVTFHSSTFLQEKFLHVLQAALAERGTQVVFEPE